MKAVLFFLFLLFGLFGFTHGFPLIDLFKDEMYFVTGPLSALRDGRILPPMIPYGVVSYYASLLVQVIVMGVLLALQGFDAGALQELIMEEPWLGYLAPRIVSLFSFLGMLVFSMRHLSVGREHERPFASWLLLILFSNLTLLSFSHSGKAWILSCALLLAAGFMIVSRPHISVVSASLSFANFPLFGLFWIQTLVVVCLKHFKERKKLFTLLALGILIPLLVSLLNIGGVIDILRIIFLDFIAGSVGRRDAETSTSIASWILLYGDTFGRYLLKVFLTSPLTIALMVVAAVTKARVRDRALFRFALAGLLLYLLGISIMFNSRDLLAFLRYLLPFHVLAILLVCALEFRVTPLSKFAVPLIGFAAVFTAIMTTANLARETTYEKARGELLQSFNDHGTVILSDVHEISFPYSREGAEIVRSLLPDRCAHRCGFALENDVEVPLKSAYILVHNNEVARELLKNLPSDRRVVRVRYDSRDLDAVDAEYGLGSYFVREAWLPSTLGKGVLVDVLFEA